VSSSTDSRTTVTDTVITAHDVSEVQFLLLPAVLGCLRGGLGRYKASDDKATLILSSHHWESTTPNAVTEWLRSQRIAHDIEVTYSWTPIAADSPDSESTQASPA
jgi:hypothetical protein